MPVERCMINGRQGYRWGRRGKCYGYTSGNETERKEAKRKAIVQGIAAGERPTASVNGRALTALLQTATVTAEHKHLPELVAAYQQALDEAGTKAAEQFALTAAADWQPPAEGAVLTAAQLAALTTTLQERLSPIWTRILLEIPEEPLARIEIAWDVTHPLAQSLLANAAKRTGSRLGSASQFILRDIIAKAYAEGLSVRDASALIQSAMRDAAPWQAEMLARMDLNGLSNGSSKAAAQLTGMGFKTWDSTLDAVTRPEHMEAHGQTVAINDVFVVGGEECDYPGSAELSDAMACNCRCSVVFGEDLAEAESLLASAGGSNIVTRMASKTQRKRKQARRAAHGTKVEALAVATAPAIVAAPRAVRFTGTAAIEGRIADDNSLTPRALLPESLEWPEMPVSFMAQTVTAEGHDGAEVAGRVDDFARTRGTGRLRNVTMAGELTTPYGIGEIAPMIDDETMRYVSADLGATEWALINRKTFDEVPQEEFDMGALADGEYALGLKSGKIKAVTLVPTQALEGAMVALTASADGTEATLVFPIQLSHAEQALVASPAPLNPPREWFETPEPPGKMPLTVTKDGRVYGHLATYDSCHVGFLNGNQCVPPPKSASNYAYFHVCELDTAEGDTVTVGKLMFSPTDGGHADRGLTASKASAYYDRTGMAAAYLRVQDGQHGIWAAGSLNPDLSDEQRQEMRRQLRLHPPSGDWRPINGSYEMITALCVAVPGFPVPRVVMTVVASADEFSMEDALIASSGMIEADPAALIALEHMGLGDEDAEAERQMRVLAARADGGMDALTALIDA